MFPVCFYSWRELFSLIWWGAPAPCFPSVSPWCSRLSLQLVFLSSWTCGDGDRQGLQSDGTASLTTLVDVVRRSVLHYKRRKYALYSSQQLVITIVTITSEYIVYIYSAFYDNVSMCWIHKCPSHWGNNFLHSIRARAAVAHQRLF